MKIILEADSDLLILLACQCLSALCLLTKSVNIPKNIEKLYSQDTLSRIFINLYSDFHSLSEFLINFHMLHEKPSTILVDLNIVKKKEIFHVVALLNSLKQVSDPEIICVLNFYQWSSDSFYLFSRYFSQIYMLKNSTLSRFEYDSGKLLNVVIGDLQKGLSTILSLMERLFLQLSAPYTRLIDSINILGLSVSKLRCTPEIILSLPPQSNFLQSSHMEVIFPQMIFTEGDIELETSPKIPKYFSTTITNEYGTPTHLHCLITYECISPEIIQMSKDRPVALSSLSFLKECKITEESNSGYCFVPVALCLVTSSSYIDLFREILESLYSYLIDIRGAQVELNSLITSIEFIRLSCMLLNDTVIPPNDIQMSLSVGGNIIEVPIEASTGLPHSEKCVAILADLIDILNIIELWECIVLNRHVFLMSCNEYLLYLILEAFKELLFPLKWSLIIVPVLGPKLIEFMAAPVPILIGLNSAQITVQQALRENPSACILDIDSNILYNSNASMLCNCQKAIMSKKLQLVKAYYYVSRERLSSYRMHSLEKNIDDQEFVKTVKMLIGGDPIEREKIFIALIKHIFLDFFLKGLDKFNKFFAFDSFKEKFEFDHQKFLNNIKKCESCKMGEFWKGFIESSTFQQFLEYEGKLDDSYYKRYFEILNCVSKGEYRIYNPYISYKFEITRSVTPRTLLALIREDVFSKPQNFLTDSIKILRKEVKEKLLYYKDYYRQGEGGIRYRSRKKFSINTENEFNENLPQEDQFLYYGKFGIIRLSTLLMSHLSKENFHNFSLLNDDIYLRLDSQHFENRGIWEPLMLKLFYLVKNENKTWNINEIKNVLRKLSFFNLEHISMQIVVSILNEIFLNHPDESPGFSNLHGEIGIFCKSLMKTVGSPYLKGIETNYDDPNTGSFTERANLYTSKTNIRERNDIPNYQARRNTKKKTLKP